MFLSSNLILTVTDHNVTSVKSSYEICGKQRISFFHDLADTNRMWLDPEREFSSIEFYHMPNVDTESFNNIVVSLIQSYTTTKMIVSRKKITLV